METGTILDRIVAEKRREAAIARDRRPLARLMADLDAYVDQPGAQPRGLRCALSRVPGEVETVRLLAEVKKASPSAGVIREDFHPVTIGRIYESHGVAAISVLTDVSFFQGCLQDLTDVRAAVTVPVLRKDFVIEEYQVLEARCAGADAVLLIAEILDDAAMSRLLSCARGLGMDVLVEFHDAENLSRVLDAGADLVGINNRDLRRFVTRLELTLELREKIPPGVVLVSESGIKTAEDVRRLAAARVDAILVGESLMRSPDIGAAVDALMGRSGPRVSPGPQARSASE